MNPKCRDWRPSLQVEKVYFCGEAEVIDRCEVEFEWDVQVGSAGFGQAGRQAGNKAEWQ